MCKRITAGIVTSTPLFKSTPNVINSLLTMEKRQLVAIKKKRKRAKSAQCELRKSRARFWFFGPTETAWARCDVKISCKSAAGIVKRRCACRRFNLFCSAFDHPQTNPTETPVTPLLNDRSDRNDKMTCVCFSERFHPHPYQWKKKINVKANGKAKTQKRTTLLSGFYYKNM